LFRHGAQTEIGQSVDVQISQIEVDGQRNVLPILTSYKELTGEENGCCRLPRAEIPQESAQTRGLLLSIIGPFNKTAHGGDRIARYYGGPCEFSRIAPIDGLLECSYLGMRGYEGRFITETGMFEKPLGE